MSPQLISRSPDLRRLRDEGYSIEVVDGHLVMNEVPYVDSGGAVRRGRLVSQLTLGGNRTTRPNTHVVYFDGDQPCHRNGKPIRQIQHSAKRKRLGSSLVVERSFSNKPKGGFGNYYDKMTSYANILQGPAESLDSAATARVFGVFEASEDDGAFQYLDTASTRAGIQAITKKIRGQRLAIIGLGGTGSYVLDLVAKCPVAEVHLFDDDLFLQHNAFRAPGAASLDELTELLTKVAYFGRKYSQIHRGIVEHPYRVTRSRAAALPELDFAFVCVDSGEARAEITGLLADLGLPFIDVGMGVLALEESQELLGVLRVTTSTPSMRSHLTKGGRLPTQGHGPGVYDQNIQIVELNSLNAALAVIRWKKLYGFYQDTENEHFSTYSINSHLLTGEDGG